MNVTVNCPAKLNEFLSVGPKDSSGYHPIRTVMQTVTLSDILSITDEGDESSFEANISLPERNTVTKALSLITEYRDVPPLTIRLNKQVPTQSGLGGGSSDAAGLLSVINKFLKIPLKKEELHEIAFAVGADVPFFLTGGRAQAEGYGERIIPLPPMLPRFVLIAQPAVACSTAEMYSMLDNLDYPFLDLDQVVGFYNDFTRVAPVECLNLIDYLNLSEGRACLTGSGSAVFAYFETASEAVAAEERLASEGTPWTWVGMTK